jgi:hypothetical protein
MGGMVPRSVGRFCEKIGRVDERWWWETASAVQSVVWVL